MSKKEILIEIFEPDNTPLRSNSNNNTITATKDYVGLNNQGNTCYLNSLLQALFMTPEFRFKILNWIYRQDKHSIKSDCIPYQIKKLFARLQLKSRGSEETKDLTKSFQWEKMEVNVQHDIQELCRVLFDVIESSLSNEEENFINTLFEGETIQIVKCLSCLNESIRSDKFLDISLPIRNDFLNICNKSVEMAFLKYLKPELLGTENQYKCESCDKKVQVVVIKVNAEKFMKFTRLPKILFVQLNRFDFDNISMNKKKIYDKVTYPEILNMNHFYNQDFTKINDFFNPKYLNTLDERKVKSNLDDEIKQALEQGPLVYELYAILSHTGTANSGHYKAYIKSFENGKWYCFDDSVVFEIKKDGYKHIFGSIIENEKSNSETPYILLYKLLTLNNLISCFDKSMIDQSLVDSIEEENKLILIEEEKAREKAQNLILRFHLNDQIKYIHAKKLDILSDTKKTVMKEFGLSEIKEQNVRIRAFNISITQMLESYFEESKTIEDVHITPNKNYTLEIKRDIDEFEIYDPNEIIISIIIWDKILIYTEEKEYKFQNLKINRYDKLYILNNRILSLFNLPSETEIMIYRKIDIGKNNFSITLFNTKENLNDNKDMTECGLYDTLKLYVEIKNETWKESNFIRMFNEKTPVVKVNFNMPMDLTLVKYRISMNSYKFNNEIELKKNQTIKELKSKIGEIIKHSNKEFIMRKFTHNGQEIKASNDTLDKLGTNSINLFIELGMSLDEIKIKVILCEHEEKFSIFPYKMKEMGVFIINSFSTILEIKDSLCEELKTKHKIEIDKDFVILRDYAFEKPTKVFQNNQIVKSFKFTDLKKICVQEYKHEKLDFSNDQILTTIRFWDPSKWILSPSKEIIIQKKISCNELNSLILKIFTDIKEDKLSVLKIVNCNNLYLEDFEKLKFENLFSLIDNYIDNTPLFLNSDGNLLIIKDDIRQLRDPTNEEIILYCKPKGKYSSKTDFILNQQNSKKSEIEKKSRFSKVGQKNRIKEQSIQIKVKKDVDKKNGLEEDTIKSNDKTVINENCISEYQL